MKVQQNFYMYCTKLTLCVFLLNSGLLYGMESTDLTPLLEQVEASEKPIYKYNVTFDPRATKVGFKAGTNDLYTCPHDENEVIMDDGRFLYCASKLPEPVIHVCANALNSVIPVMEFNDYQHMQQYQNIDTQKPFEFAVGHKDFLPHTFVMMCGRNLIIKKDYETYHEYISQDLVNGDDIGLLELHKTTLYFLLSNWQTDSKLALYKKELDVNSQGIMGQAKLVHEWDEHSGLLYPKTYATVNETGTYMVTPFANGFDVVELEDGKILETHMEREDDENHFNVKFFSTDCYLVAKDSYYKPTSSIGIYKIAMGQLWKFALDNLKYERFANFGPIAIGKDFVSTAVLKKDSEQNQAKVLIWKMPLVEKLVRQKMQQAKILQAQKNDTFTDVVITTKN